VARTPASDDHPVEKEDESKVAGLKSDHHRKRKHHKPHYQSNRHQHKSDHTAGKRSHLFIMIPSILHLLLTAFHNATTTDKTSKHKAAKYHP